MNNDKLFLSAYAHLQNIKNTNFIWLMCIPVTAMTWGIQDKTRNLSDAATERAKTALSFVADLWTYVRACDFNVTHIIASSRWKIAQLVFDSWP